MDKYDAIVIGSGISGGWAAKELTRIETTGNTVNFHAPFACPQFTASLSGASNSAPRLTIRNQSVPLAEAAGPLNLKSATFVRQQGGVIACLDLPKGDSSLMW